MERDIAVMQPRAKENQELPEESGKDLLLEALAGAWPC